MAYNMEFNDLKVKKGIDTLADSRGYRGANVLIEKLCKVHLNECSEELALAEAKLKKKR